MNTKGGTGKYMEPFIETERLYLRLFRLADLETAYELFNDDEVQKHLSPKNRRTREQLRISLEKFIAHWSNRGFGLFCVTEKKTEQMIGYCGFQYVEKSDNVELLFAFLKKYWGQGFATEAARACLDYGFEKLGFEKVYAVTDPQNTASQIVLKKNNMSYDETLFLYDMNVVVFSVTKTNFIAR